MRMKLYFMDRTESEVRLLDLRDRLLRRGRGETFETNTWWLEFQKIAIN